jgi:hypothetical protein
MMSQDSHLDSGPNWFRIIARILATLWFGFWAFFAIASGIGEGGSNLIFHLLFPALTFFILWLIIWFWETPGSYIMIAVALAIGISYPLTMGRRFPAMTSILMELTMALPLLLAGILLILGRRKSGSVPKTPIDD